MYLNMPYSTGDIIGSCIEPVATALDDRLGSQLALHWKNDCPSPTLIQGLAIPSMSPREIAGVHGYTANCRDWLDAWKEFSDDDDLRNSYSL